MRNYILTTILSIAISNSLISQELIIGEERIDPGIVFIFEGAVKDIIYPENYNLAEELTDKIGNPKSFRAVGTACGKNPLPIIIPCHRVKAKSGLGGFTGGLEIKRFLLNLESN